MILHGKSNTKTKFFAERIIRGESPQAGKVQSGRERPTVRNRVQKKQAGNLGNKLQR